MIFKQKNKKINEIQLQISDVGLTRTNKIKYLGLILDDQLNWSAHIDHIKEKAISMTGALYRCRNFLTKMLNIIFTMHTFCLCLDTLYQFGLHIKSNQIY